MFQFPASRPIQLWIHCMVCILPMHGFPHSDIDGSQRAYRSPSRFAVCCVLLRLSVPRHPPYALLRFTLFLLSRSLSVSSSSFRLSSERPSDPLGSSISSFLLLSFRYYPVFSDLFSLSVPTLKTKQLTLPHFVFLAP